MKKLLLLATAFTFSASLFAQKKIADVAKFETETINQGNLKQNEPKEVKFVVTNISNEPLIIEQASPTCGCTIGDYTKSPIAPGATGFISAKFNALTVGHFDKHLTVKFAGVDETKSITITGNVLEAAEYDKWSAEMVEAKKKADTPAPAVKSNKPAAKTAAVANKQ
ncbi:MAG TPA: DUF1573 domain-containing protein [Ferruginibacter sp.]|nr:hypothetical protein [Chitinophagaceae bacterium]HRI24773.1 DUF1573 domain-containing protein [Ferruginibacter sp.]